MKIKKILKKAVAVTIAGFALTSASLLTSPFTVQAARYNKSAMRRFVRSTLNAYWARGAAVIIKDGEPEAINWGYGFYGHRLDNGSSRLTYPVCSLQKEVTAAIATQLIYEHKFNQNSRLFHWYPNLKNNRRITVGNLMTHTSGIVATGTENNRHHFYSENRAINWVIKRANHSRHDAIGSFHYNNTNYILLAGIIAKVTHQSYAANVRERVIDRLGLRHTFMNSDLPRNISIARSYNYYRGFYHHSTYANTALTSQLPGAANLYSTPMDYYKIQLALTNGQILTAHQYHYMTHLHTTSSNGYSGGLYTRNNDQLRSSFGNLQGNHYGNVLQMTNDNQNGIILFLNQTQDNERVDKAIAYQILNHIRPYTFDAR